MPLDSPVIKKEEKEVTELAGTWNVLVFDDPVNLMEYVTKVFQKVFGYERAKCEELMFQVHNNGKALVWTGERERAEFYASPLQISDRLAS